MLPKGPKRKAPIYFIQGILSVNSYLSVESKDAIAPETLSLFEHFCFRTVSLASGSEILLLSRWKAESDKVGGEIDGRKKGKKKKKRGGRGAYICRVSFKAK